MPDKSSQIGPSDTVLIASVPFAICFACADGNFRHTCMLRSVMMSAGQQTGANANLTLVEPQTLHRS
eukprot:scaffold431791_cov14-Prasinocladus_malaysianus.AAC.1